MLLLYDYYSNYEGRYGREKLKYWAATIGEIEVFENCLYDKVVVVDEVPLISVPGLIMMKQQLGREKDLKDIELIKRRKGQPAVEVLFYDGAEDRLLKFAVIIARTGDQWVFCKHRKRETYEIPDGHREPSEAILDTARRELYEETGAIDYELRPVCVYSVTAADNFDGEETFGMLYVASIRTFEAELHSEIEKILITDRLTDSWTYPQIQPLMIAEAARRGFLGGF